MKNLVFFAFLFGIAVAISSCGTNPDIKKSHELAEQISADFYVNVYDAADSLYANYQNLDALGAVAVGFGFKDNAGDLNDIQRMITLFDYALKKDKTAAEAAFTKLSSGHFEAQMVSSLEKYLDQLTNSYEALKNFQ